MSFLLQAFVFIHLQASMHAASSHNYSIKNNLCCCQI